MLTRVVASEFSRPTSSGRTRPLVLICERRDGSTVEVVAKFTVGCEQGVINLSREAISACLAADLGLPVPEAFLVEIPEGFADAVPDAVARAKIAASSPCAFGSKLVTGQFSTWSNSSKISATMLPMAAAIFTFDAIIQNVDRRGSNPNCLVRGDEFRIFDHELAFSHGMIVGWRPPWMAGGLNALETPGIHIFREGLRLKNIDFGSIREAWQGLSEEKMLAYESVLPPEWTGAEATVAAAISLIRDARDNIDGCLTEIQRVLQ